VRDAGGVRRALLSAAGVAAALQVGPAATWLPSIRRTVTPSLLGRGDPTSVAVTFDDGPHPEGTPATLDMLDDLGWRATFFVLGEQARAHPDVVRETARRGHEIAVHGDAHRYLIARTPRAAADDLRRAHVTVTEIVGAEPVWWRPPYGVLSGPAVLSASRLRLRPVLWSTWGRDWRPDATPASVVADILSAGGLDGSTVLLHDSDVTSARDSWRTAVAALPLLADVVTDAGLKARTLTEHMGHG